jgi:hypothetical protein
MLFFLGLIKEHFQGILGTWPETSFSEPKLPLLHINIPTDPSNPLPSSKRGKASVRQLISLLQNSDHFNFDLTKEKEKFNKLVNTWGTSQIHVSAFVYVRCGLNCIQAALENNKQDTESSYTSKYSKKELAKLLFT